MQVTLATDDDSVDSSCALTVKIPNLVIIEGLKDQEAKEGDKVQLSVEVNTPPKSVKWCDLKFLAENCEILNKVTSLGIFLFSDPNLSSDELFY